MNSQNNVITLSLEQKQSLLDTHNQYRQDCAKGLYTINGPQYASNMIYLFWDKGLEDLAKIRASRCYSNTFGGIQGLLNDFNENKENITFIEPISGYTVGENIAILSENPPISQYSDNIYLDSIMNWAIEGESYDWPNDICYGNTCDNWKQLCSGPTRYVGCALSECYDGINNSSNNNFTDSGMILVCNYYPSVEGNHPFEDGLIYDWCIRCQQWDVQICENTLCKGGKARDFLASGLINKTIDQCNDGVGRIMDPCTTIDPTKVPTKQTEAPVKQPTKSPSNAPTIEPTKQTISPTINPTLSPTNESIQPSIYPTKPTILPIIQSTTKEPTISPTLSPTIEPTGTFNISKANTNIVFISFIIFVIVISLNN